MSADPVDPQLLAEALDIYNRRCPIDGTSGPALTDDDSITIFDAIDALSDDPDVRADLGLRAEKLVELLRQLQPPMYSVDIDGRAIVDPAVLNFAAEAAITDRLEDRFAWPVGPDRAPSRGDA